MFTPVDFKGRDLTTAGEANSHLKNRSQVIKPKMKMIITRDVIENRIKEKTKGLRRVIMSQSILRPSGNKYLERDTVSKTFFKEVQNPIKLRESTKQAHITNKRLREVLKRSSCHLGSTKVDYKTIRSIQFDKAAEEFEQFFAKAVQKRDKVSLSLFDERTKMLEKLYFIKNRPKLSLPNNDGEKLEEKEREFERMIEKARQTLIKKCKQDRSRQQSACDGLDQRQIMNESGKNWMQPFTIDRRQSLFGITMPALGTITDQSIEPLRQSSSFATQMKQRSQSVAALFRQNQSESLNGPIRKKFFNLDDHKIHNPVNQTFHILGDDHIPVRPSTTKAGGNRNVSLTASSSRQLNSKTHEFRSSFQDQFTSKSIDKQFQKDCQDLHRWMKKPNIHFQHGETQSTHYPETSKSMRQTSYSNTNLVNHIPFAGKEEPPSLNGTRFGTNYGNFHKVNQEPKCLLQTFDDNNDKNKHYMERIVKENHFLGKCSQTEQEQFLKSEKQVNYYRTTEQAQVIMNEYFQGKAPQQVCFQNKAIIEQQNCTVKQPLNSGGNKFIDERKKAASIGYAIEHLNLTSQNPFDRSISTINPEKLRTTCSAAELKRLNFKDKMMNHRSTNFRLGNLGNAPQASSGVQLKQFQDSSKLMNGSGFHRHNQTQQLASKLKQTMKTVHVALGSDNKPFADKSDYNNNFKWTVPKYAI